MISLSHFLKQSYSGNANIKAIILKLTGSFEKEIIPASYIPLTSYTTNSSNHFWI